MLLARAYEAKGELKKAYSCRLAVLERHRALGRSAHVGESVQNLAVFAMRNAMPVEAVEWARESVSHQPGDSQPLVTLAQALLAAGHWEEAISTAEELVPRSGGSPLGIDPIRVRVVVAVARGHLGQLETAEDLLRSALSDVRSGPLAGSPLESEVLEATAQFLEEAGRASEAAALLEAASSVTDREAAVGSTSPGVESGCDANATRETPETIRREGLGDLIEHRPLPPRVSEPSSLPAVFRDDRGWSVSYMSTFEPEDYPEDP